MKNKKSTLINVSAAIVTFIVQLIIGFWLSPFLVSKLGEEAYGFINLANNFVSYASLVTVALNSMACRYISVEYNSKKYEEAKKYFCSVFIINCILFGLIFIISLILISKIQLIVNISYNLINQVKLTFLFSFINMGISMIGTVYTAAAFTTNKMHYSSFVQFISNIFKVVIVFVLYMLLPAKVYYLSLATLIAGITTLICNYYITKKILKGFGISKKYFELKKIIILIKSGFWMLISNISNMLLNGFDLLLSNWFISANVMGRLSLAKQIPYAIGSALGIFSNIFSSSLTKNFATNGENNLVQETKEQLKLLTLFFTVPFAGIIIFGREFLELWLNDNTYSFVELNEIYMLMIITLLDIIINAYIYSIHSLFIAVDKVKSYSKVLFISSVLSILITIILLKVTNLGVYAIAATSTIILGITHAIIVPAIIAKLLNKKIYVFWLSELKSWGVLTIMCLVFFVIKKFITIITWFDFFKNIVWIGIIGYIISIFLLLNKSEKKMIYNWGISKIKKLVIKKAN